MFDDVLIESAGTDKKEPKRGWVTTLISTAIHLGLVGAVLAAARYGAENREVTDEPMAAFIVAPAPPPPPPPPPARSSGITPQPKVETKKLPSEFRQPKQVPQDVPQVESKDDDDADDGGVVGGMKGGKKGGVVGGEVGGQVGGTVGGKIGGVIGGTGDAPFQVGGNVKPPLLVTQVRPQYTEMARKARVHGEIIIEAVIDRQGNVTDTRVLKSLPFGLEQEALRAIRLWKYKPGTLHGQPVPVYFRVTILFQLN